MHANTLIELAMQHVERKSVRSLAERVGVSHTKVSEWKNGTKPVPDERIQQLAKIAGQDPGPWLLLIKSEQDEGELGRLWAKLAKRLGAVATVLLVAALPYTASAKSTLTGVSGTDPVCIMRNTGWAACGTGWPTSCVAASPHPATWRLAPHGFDRFELPPAVLAL